ncbi:alanine--tRNA ligase-related protein [Rhizobium terrae]|uniref:alanine--tRNA ligase-related protein n=1 Tax=Rhizobium terrae TaxID=2171756 RepID=UPI000E3CD64B|nr:alanyl-tRNA editing protein [Rhizobium terrae]
MSTRLEFLDDPYQVETEAFVLSRRGNQLILDRSVFYPGIGVSPADQGVIILDAKRQVKVNRSDWHDEQPGILVHFCEALPEDVAPGTKVIARIDWGSRFAAMRTHTALHLVSVALPYPMIEGEIHAGWGSATFEVDSTGLGARELENVVQDLVQRKLPVKAIWTLPPLRGRRVNVGSFAWPGSNGKVRAISIDDVDEQPCDGLHVRNTFELGQVEITDLRRLEGRGYLCELRIADAG